MQSATDETPADDSLEENDGRLVIPAGGIQIDDKVVRALRDADDQRRMWS